MAVGRWLALIREALAVPSERITEGGLAVSLVSLLEELYPGARASVHLTSGSESTTGSHRPDAHPDDRIVTDLVLHRNGPVIGKVVLEGSKRYLRRVDRDTLVVIGEIAGSIIGRWQLLQRGTELLHEARHEAWHDSLTGLANRPLLLDRLAHAIQRSRRSGDLVAVMFVDLDRFKRINDIYGHHVGDELLVALAERLGRDVRRDDTVARLAGDEFVVVCEGLEDRAQGDVIAGHLARVINEPFDLSVGHVSVSASIGIAFAGPSDMSAEQLIDHADAAMYQAKHSGGAGYTVLDLRERRRNSQLAEMEFELRGAAQRDELRAVYQPILETVTARVVGVEALLRWRHPRLGEVSPALFVPVAERSGAISQLGDWVLARASADVHSLTSVAPLSVSVNVSGRQIMDGPALIRSVERILESGQHPERLTLELTEQMLVDDSEAVKVTLADLKALGVSLALDDFGVGYSSLNYLSRMPIDVVKIDQSFVAQLGSGSSHQAIVHSVVTLAHVLGMSVVAEGVETAEQHELVTALGCDYSQGYFHSQPLPISEIEGLLDRSPQPSW